METLVQIWGTALEYMRLLRFTDLIDVAVIALIIYKGMAMMRRSSAAQVVKALLFIMAALWLSYQLNLNVINFILGKAMELGLLALVIVFQPEIRRFLEQIGSNNLSSVFGQEVPVSEIEAAIAQTVAAYAEMSRNKVGALTVFERRNLMDGIIETGTVLDAAVSSELLKNIFYPKAPLHDGAVVIRDGRVAGAGCVLPLSANTNLSRDLGMRHRAGIGMSEHSDAVVAIVSEESGGISVAVNGRLRRHLAPETLERVLRNELIPRSPEEAKRSFRQKVTGLFQRKGGQSL